jgi:hypothetical protein
MKARILETNNFGGLYSDDFIIRNNLSDWNFTEQLPSKEIIKPIFNGTEWIEDATAEEIAELEIKKSIEDIKTKYELHKLNGWNAYQDFRAKIVLDIQNEIITEVQAFIIESDLKIAYDRIAQNGDWKTAYFELSQITVSNDVVQPYLDLALSYIINYINLNYDA